LSPLFYLHRPLAAGLLLCALAAAQVPIKVSPATPLVNTLAAVDVPAGISFLAATAANQIGFRSIAANAVDVVGWSLPGAASNITISAYISSGAQVTAYLTTQIGPGTTVSNEVRSITLTGASDSTNQPTVIFSGLTLSAGNYYLTVTSTATTPAANTPRWYEVDTAPGPYVTNVAGGATGLFEGATNTPAGYPPASTFNDLRSGQQTGSPAWDALLFDVAAVDTSSLPAATVGNPYTATVTATGCAGACTWSAQLATGGPLPGLAIDSNSGVISGTPTLSGTLAITVTATDAQSNHTTQGMSIPVNVGGKVVTTSLPANLAIVNISGTQDLSNHANGDLTWKQPFSTTSRLVEYTVPAGEYTFRVISPTDASSLFPALTPGQTSSMETAWTYNSPWITTWLAFDSSAATNTAETQLFSGADGGPGLGDAASAYNDAISNGYENSLYPLIRTAPPQKTWYFPNPATLIFTVPDDQGSDNQGGVSVLIAPTAAQAPGIATSSLANGQAGVAYTPANMSATGGYGGFSYAWTATGLPPGLTLSSTGSLSGTPAHIGTYSVTLTVTDRVSGLTFTQASPMPITIAAPSPALSIGTTSLPAGETGVSYSATVASAGGFGTVVWSVSAGAPLSIDAGTGLLTSSGPLGSENLPAFTVTATASDGETASRNYTVTVSSALSITTTSVPSADLGGTYGFQLVAANGAGGNAWTISPGSLPPGMTLTSGGLISGRPGVAGTVGFTANVTDSAGGTASRGLSITVVQPVGYVVVNRGGSLVSVAGDGTLGPLTSSAGGYDVAQDPSGNLIVANMSTLTRVTPSGVASTIATTSSAGWVAVTTDAAGNIIVADNVNHQLWRISPDGLTQTPVGHYQAQNADNAEDAKVVVDSAGDYVVANDNSGVHISRITPAGAVTNLTLSGQSTPSTVGGLTLDGAGNYMLLDYAQNLIFQISPAGAVSVFTSGFSTGPQLLGLARNPVTGEYVVGGSNGTVQKVSPDGSTISPFVANGNFLTDPEGIVAISGDYPATMISTRPLGYFRLETAVGTSEVNNYTYAMTSGATVSTPGAPTGSPSNNFALLDGTSAASVTTTLAGGITTAASIAAWVNLSALPSVSNLTDYIAGESQSGNDLDLQFTSDNVLRFYTTASSQNINYTPDPSTLAGHWHMVAATFDNTAGKRAIYWDGALVASDTAASSPNKTTAFQIGSSPVFSGRNLYGGLDEVGLWNYALSPEQIYRLYVARGTASSPPVSSISPTTAPVNSAATDLTISGFGFASGATVRWTGPDGQTTILTPSSIAAQQLVVSVPAAQLTAAGTAEVSVSAASGLAPSNQLPFAITPSLTLNPAAISDLTVGAPYSQILTASGGSGSYTWQITHEDDSLDLTLTPSVDTHSATLAGTAVDVPSDGTTLTIRVTDQSIANLSASRSYHPNINPAPSVPPGSVPSGTTAWVLNSEGSLVAINGTVGTRISPDFDCEWCYDMARDAAGNFILAAGDRIRRVSPSGETLADIRANDGSFYASVAVDVDGNYIVVDNQLHQITRMPPNQTSGVPGTLVFSYNGDTINSPQDAYVRIDPAGFYILGEDSAVDGAQGLSMFRISPDGTQHTQLSLHPAVSGGPMPSSIGGLTLDAQGNYVITDWAGDQEGVYTVTPAGAVNPMFVDRGGAFSDIEGISRDPISGQFFMVDDDNNTLFAVNPDGTGFAAVLSNGPISKFPGAVLIVNNVPQGTTDYVLQSDASIVPIGPLSSPLACDPSVCTGTAYDFAADASGNFIIADGSRLVKVTQENATSLIATAPETSLWVSVAVDSTGNYIVADDARHQLVKITPAGVITPIASYSNFIENSDFEEDAIVRIDSGGNYILVHDNGEFDRILRITPAGGPPTGITLSGTLPGTVGGFTIDASGNYVVIDYNQAQVFKITPAGASSPLVANPHNYFETPSGVFYDPATAHLLVVDREVEGLFSVSSDGSQVTPIPADLIDPITVLSISTSPLTITTSALPAGTQGQSYTLGPLTATGGSGNYRWSATGLPSGLTMSLTGTISGTLASNSPAQSTVNVTATDASNASLTATRSYTLVAGSAAAPPPPPPPAVTISSSTSLIATKVGSTISASFTARSGTPPYTFSATGVPAGVTFSSAALSGPPTQAGVFTVIVTVTDSQRVSAQTSVNIDVLGLTTLSLPSGTAGQAYAATIGATGGSSGYAFSAAGLPPGVSLASDGTLSGTPATAGAYMVNVTVVSGGVSVSGSFGVTIARPGPLSITSNTLPGGTINLPYSQPLAAHGGLPPYTWSIISGTLPDGLSLAASGAVSGTPTAPGAVSFGAQVTDSAGATATGSVALTIRPAPLVITTQSLPSGMNGVDYPVQLLAATGGVSPYTWSTGNSNSLPGGMTFAADGSLRGVPSAAGSYSLAAVVTDATGTKVNAAFSLTVRPQSADLILTASSLQFSISAPAASAPDAQTVGVQSTVASQTIAYSYSVSPAAPWLSVAGGATTPDTLQVSITAAALSLSAGDYQTTITATCTSTSCAGHKQSVAVALAVTSTPPKLQIGTTLLSFATTIASAGPLSQPINLQNGGGGTIGFASVTCEDVWCTAGAAPATLAGGGSASIAITVDPTVVRPGFYRTQADIVSSAGRGSVPVTLFVAPSSTMTLAPAGQQFNMPAGSAPGNPSGSFLVSVNNATPANWTASVLPDAPWLVLGTGTGSSSSTQPGPVAFSIDPKAAAALAPGAYYGRIRVVSPDLSNSPQDFEVILNVVAATAPLVPDPQPGGLLFITALGGTLPPQTINVYSGSTAPLPFQTSAATADGGNWLSITPATGSASAGAPGVTTVNISTNGLKAGVYHGGVSFSLSATAVRTVNVTLIVSSPASSAAAVSGNFTRRDEGCVASRLAPAQTGLVNNFSQPAAWPTPLAIQLSNDCGGLVANGQVVATFSNGDPPLVLPLVDPGKALYSGTWSPRKTGSQISINVRASAPGLPVAISQIAGAVTPNAAPSLTPHGALHSFDPLVGGSLAPGTIIQIYGENLASQTAQPSAIPLPNNLNGTQVLIGGIESPLYYVSAGQVNAQIPFELEPGKQYQVLISANGALTTPDTVQLSDATPGLAVFADGTLIAQHGDGTLVSKDSPAQPGEYLVAYGAGMGGTNATPASGAASPSSPLATPADPPTLLVNGAPAPLLFAGLTPGLVGLYQLNFQVPAGLTAGDLTIVVTQAGLSSNQAVLPYAP